MSQTNVTPFPGRTAEPSLTDAHRGDILLRRAEVERRVGLSRSAIYRRLAAGDFPRPLDVGGGAVRWRASAIAQWIDSRAAR